MRRRGVWIGAVATAGIVAVVVGAGIMSGGGPPDPVRAFCRDAQHHESTLAAAGPDRAEALSVLVDTAPDDLAELVREAGDSFGDTGVAVDDLFVVPGDWNSDVRVDVAAELFGQMTVSRQAWDRVEQVLVGDCELDLKGSGQ